MGDLNRKLQIRDKEITNEIAPEMVEVVDKHLGQCVVKAVIRNKMYSLLMTL